MIKITQKIKTFSISILHLHLHLHLLYSHQSFAAASGLDVSRLQHLVAQPVDRTKDASGLNSNAYEYHSNEIIELLQRLMKQFKARKEKLFVEESTEKHAFEKVEQARQFEITTTTEVGTH